MVRPEFDEIGPEGAVFRRARVVKAAGKYGVLDRRGKWLSAPEFDEIQTKLVNGVTKGIRRYPSCEDCSPSDHFAYIEENGRAFTKAVLAEAEDFEPTGVARVALKWAGGYGVVNRRGEWVIAPIDGVKDASGLSNRVYVSLVPSGSSPAGTKAALSTMKGSSAGQCYEKRAISSGPIRSSPILFPPTRGRWGSAR